MPSRTWEGKAGGLSLGGCSKGKGAVLKGKAGGLLLGGLSYDQGYTLSRTRALVVFEKAAIHQGFYF